MDPEQLLAAAHMCELLNQRVGPNCNAKTWGSQASIVCQTLLLASSKPSETWRSFVLPGCAGSPVLEVLEVDERRN